ncbi:MAG: hypothetical protein ACSLFK_04210 [Gemmatimonadaceae bacterium]
MRYIAALAAFAMLVAACEKQDTPATGDTAIAGAETTATTASTASADSDEAKIADAESAAPDSISKLATIMDWPATEGGAMRQLRAGSNGWVCYTSTPNPTSAIGQDPMCLDATFQKWMEAFMAGASPNITSVGFAYMLKGDRGASNTDPMARDSTASNNWVRTGSHVMLVGPAAAVASLPTTPGANPWVMWKGTPYAHVMIRVE